MPRGKKVVEVEVRLIHNLKKDGFSNRQIAKHVGRSLDLVNKVIKDTNYHLKPTKSRRKPALSAKEKRLLIRKASNSMATVKKIAADVNVSCSIKTVKRFLNAQPILKRLKIKRRPVLNKGHIAKRLSYAKQHMSWTKQWNYVTFTDEKRFCLDGPDCYSYYFHDIRKPELQLMSRQQGGGGVMLWGAVTAFGKYKFTFVEGTLNSESYIKLLNDEYLPFHRSLRSRNMIFQQDNARPHTAAATRLQEHNITVMDWPARSPDLNIIENLWSMISDKVYSGGKQYNNVRELKLAIERACADLDVECVTKLYDSLPNRMYEVINKQGRYTHY